MANPLLEACLVRTGTRLAFRHSGAMVDPIRRQLLFDPERARLVSEAQPRLAAPALLHRAPDNSPRGIQDRFLAAVSSGRGEREAPRDSPL